MILAQRALIAASYDYSAFTQAGEPRVLRFWLKDPNDPPSPGRWKPAPEEYAVGFAGNDRNTNGGVALGYGYGRGRHVATEACEAALWSTGQNLRNNPALRSQLEPGGRCWCMGCKAAPPKGAQCQRRRRGRAISSIMTTSSTTRGQPATSAACDSHASLAARGIASAQSRHRHCHVHRRPAPQACKPTCICPPGTELERQGMREAECPDGQVFDPAMARASAAGTVMKDGMIASRGSRAAAR